MAISIFSFPPLSEAGIYPPADFEESDFSLV